MIFGRRKVGASSESLVDIFGNLLFVPAVVEDQRCRCPWP